MLKTPQNKYLEKYLRTPPFLHRQTARRVGCIYPGGVQKWPLFKQKRPSGLYQLYRAPPPAGKQLLLSAACFANAGKGTNLCQIVPGHYADHGQHRIGAGSPRGWDAQILKRGGGLPPPPFRRLLKYPGGPLSGHFAIHWEQATG